MKPPRDRSVTDVTVVPVDIALREPFGIATGAKTAALNVFVRVTLADGSEGWGEAAPFEAVNGEHRAGALRGLETLRAAIMGFDAAGWRTLPALLRAACPDSPSARCAVETALLDSWCRSLGVPLRALFGGAHTALESDLTITTGTPLRAAESAATIAAQGYRTIKLKVGGVPLDEDLARLSAVISAAPACALVLDGNGALSEDDAVALARGVSAAGGALALLEQPCDRHDPRAARRVFERTGVRVCADESVASPRDVAALAREGAAQAINLKITKSGVIDAHDMALTARAHGLALMIGGMVESSLAMSASAHLACGLGGVDFVDLDTPLWLLDEPVVTEMRRDGPHLSIADTTLGHGARPSDAILRALAR